MYIASTFTKILLFKLWQQELKMAAVDIENIDLKMLRSLNKMI